MAEAAASRWPGQLPVAMSVDPVSERLPSLPRPGPLRSRREGSLVREAQRGSADALEELFRRHWRRAHRAAYLVVGDAAAAEDIAQESFLAAIRALDRFDRRRPFGPWLHRITVNRAIDFARARALRAESALSPAVEGSRRIPTRSPTSWSRALADALARAPGGDRAPLPARVHTGRDRRDPRPAARHRQLAPAPRPRPAAAGDRGGRMTRERDRELERALRELDGARRGRGRGAGLGGDPRRVRRAHPGARGDAPAGSRSRSPAASPCSRSALSPAGAKVGDLVSDVVGIGEEDAKPALRSLPASASSWSSPSRAPGSSATTARSGCSATTTRRPGRRAGCSSPPPTGASCVALEPDGDVRWTSPRPAPCVIRAGPSWLDTGSPTEVATTSGWSPATAPRRPPGRPRRRARAAGVAAAGESKVEPGDGARRRRAHLRRLRKGGPDGGRRHRRAR